MKQERKHEGRPSERRPPLVCEARLGRETDPARRRGRAPGQRWLAGSLLLVFSLVGVGCKAEPWPLWESYSAKFLDGQGRVIDHSANDASTTEGQAYAMFFALVTNDRNRFQKLLEWTETNMANGDLTLRLPAWSWGKSKEGNWGVLDPHSAADADLWMAYTLCEAGRLWGADRYAKLGEVMASRVAQQELVLVPGVGTTLLPGSEGFHPQPATFFLNPSYLPPMLLAYFARKQPTAPWGEALGSLPAMVGTDGGFVMDWLKAENGAVKPSATPAAAQDTSDAGKDAQPLGSYDAIRVYLWMGIADGKTRGVRPAMEKMQGMALYLAGHVTPPLSVDPSGKVVNADAPPGFSAAVIPYLHVLGLKTQEKTQRARLEATKDSNSGLYGHDGSYYDQNLALFATGWAEERFRFESDGKLRVKWK